MLAAISSAAGIHVIAVTGVHHDRYDDIRRWTVFAFQALEEGS